MTNVFVGDLSYFCTNVHLQELFSTVGPVTKALVKRTIEGETRHYGFVEMKHKSDSQKAIAQLNGVDFMGRVLKVRSYEAGRESDPLPGGNTSIQVHFSFLSYKVEPQINEARLSAIFADRIGPTTDCLIKRYTSSHRPTERQSGNGFVFFRELTDALKAVSELTGSQTIDDILFDCKLSRDFTHPSVPSGKADQQSCVVTPASEKIQDPSVEPASQSAVKVLDSSASCTVSSSAKTDLGSQNSQPNVANQKTSLKILPPYHSPHQSLGTENTSPVDIFKKGTVNSNTGCDASPVYSTRGKEMSSQNTIRSSYLDKSTEKHHMMSMSQQPASYSPPDQRCGQYFPMHHQSAMMPTPDMMRGSSVQHSNFTQYAVFPPQPQMMAIHPPSPPMMLAPMMYPPQSHYPHVPSPTMVHPNSSNSSSQASSSTSSPRACSLVYPPMYLPQQLPLPPPPTPAMPYLHPMSHQGPEMMPMMMVSPGPHPGQAHMSHSYSLPQFHASQQHAQQFAQHQHLTQREQMSYQYRTF